MSSVSKEFVKLLNDLDNIYLEKSFSSIIIIESFDKLKDYLYTIIPNHKEILDLWILDSNKNQNEYTIF